jgi:type IV pilus assembly protein PilX
MTHPIANSPAFRPQHGATLIIAMILLLVMSLLAVASMRGTLMQERMSANTLDRDLAFQSAEAGLKMGERQAENASTNKTTSTWADCQNPSAGGLYRNIDAKCPTPLWEGPAPGSGGSFWHDASTDSGDENIRFSSAGLSLAPFYIVELISENAPCQIDDPSTNVTCKRYRITASSQVTDGRAQVILQSIYATD